MPLFICPACHSPLTDRGSYDITPRHIPRPPRVGDLVVCPSCSAVTVLTPGWPTHVLRLATDADVRMPLEDFKAALDQHDRLKDRK